MKKKVLYLLPFLLFIFLFSGCSSENVDLSNSITFSVQILSNGEISQTIAFPTQIEEMNLEEGKKKEYISTLSNEIKSKLFFPYFYNFYTISALSQNPDFKLGGEKMSYALPTFIEENKTIAFSFIFADSEVWDFYHPKNEEEENSMEIREGVFISKGVSSSNFIFNEPMTSNGEETTLGNYFYTILSTAQQKFSANEIEKPVFTYEYSHFSNKLHTNADFAFKKEGQHISIWQENFEQLQSEKKVEIMLYSPNKWLWYSLALGSTILFVGVSCLAKYLISKKSSKNQAKEKT